MHSAILFTMHKINLDELSRDLEPEVGSIAYCLNEAVYLKELRRTLERASALALLAGANSSGPNVLPGNVGELPLTL